MKLQDLSGKKYGRLTVIKRAPNMGKETAWECLCQCGAKVIKRGSDLRSGATQSCGCKRKETASAQALSMKTHGMTGTRIYHIWYDMRRRCSYPRQLEYENYGGRGIKVCTEWDESFTVFYEWAISHGYKSNLTIDRINNDLGYSPENCKWSTYKEQNNNRRKKRKIIYNAAFCG